MLQLAGWRAIYVLAAVIVCALAVIAHRKIPELPKPARMPYPALMASVGILWFNEPATVLKIVSLVMIIVGVIGLNVNFGLARD